MTAKREKKLRKRLVFEVVGGQKVVTIKGRCTPQDIEDLAALLLVDWNDV